MSPKSNTDIEIQKNFGATVRKLRSQKGHTQEYFADMCGLDRAYFGGIERGERNLTLINIFKVLRALELKPSVFLLISTNF